MLDVLEEVLPLENLEHLEHVEHLELGTFSPPGVSKSLEALLLPPPSGTSPVAPVWVAGEFHFRAPVRSVDASLPALTL